MAIWMLFAQLPNLYSKRHIEPPSVPESTICILIRRPELQSNPLEEGNGWLGFRKFLLQSFSDYFLRWRREIAKDICSVSPCLLSSNSRINFIKIGLKFAPKFVKNGSIRFTIGSPKIKYNVWIIDIQECLCNTFIHLCFR